MLHSPFACCRRGPQVVGAVLLVVCLLDSAATFAQGRPLDPPPPAPEGSRAGSDPQFAAPTPKKAEANGKKGMDGWLVRIGIGAGWAHSVFLAPGESARHDNGLNVDVVQAPVPPDMWVGRSVVRDVYLGARISVGYLVLPGDHPLKNVVRAQAYSDFYLLGNRGLYLEASAGWMPMFGREIELAGAGGGVGLGYHGAPFGVMVDNQFGYAKGSAPSGNTHGTQLLLTSTVLVTASFR